LLPLRNLLAEALLGEQRLESAVAIVLVVTLIECLFQMAMLHLQSSLKSRAYVSFSLARMGVSIGAAYILVTRMHLGLYGVLYASLIHTGSAALVLCVLVFREVGWHFNRATAIELLRFGVPLVPGAIAMFVLNNGDRYFMRIYCSREDIGIYGLAYRLGSLTNLIILTPFLKIWSVSMVEAANAEDGRRRLGQILTLLMSAVCVAALALSALSPYLLAWITPPKYWVASEYLPVVALAYVFFGSTIVLDAAFFTTKRTYFKSIILVASCAFVIPLYSLLIKRYGVYGAAWSTVGGFAFFAVLTYVFSMKVRPIDVEFWKLAGLISGAASGYLILRSIATPLTITHFICSVVAILLFVIAVWKLPILDPRDKNELIRFIEGYKLQFSRWLGRTEVAV
jgi:O-antigen/teichoic acid export membrane protein